MAWARNAIMIFLVFLLVTGLKVMADPVPYPAFVFGHWVWEDESTDKSLRDLVKGYQERGIPVSAVIIDSPWETAYNTFEFDRNLFPDYERLLKELNEQGISVILWITCAINKEDPDYEYALEKGYFAPGLEEYKWWKGVGGLIDYENPQALEWWHKRVDRVMNLPFDGWKVDGIDGLIALKGLNIRQEYARNYYPDFYHYTKEKTGRNTVIMARGIEIFSEHTLGLPGWVNPLKAGIPLEYAPREVSFATWMGDQDPTWNGMRAAYRSFKKSALEGYLVPGFDIFGYRDGEPDKELFLRWAQWGAFSPFMENGGIAEHRPWAYGHDAVEIYRHYAVWHEELGWYLYSIGEERFENGRSLVKPAGKGYLLGDDIYVQPILKPGLEKKQVIVLPEGSFRDWNNLSKRYCSGEKTHLGYPIHEFPVFIREGALIPLWVKSEFAGHRLKHEFSEQNTLLLLPGEGRGETKLIYLDGMKAKLEWTRKQDEVKVRHTGQSKELVLIVEGALEKPETVILSGKNIENIEKVEKKSCDDIMPASDSAYCMKNNRLWIKIEPYENSFDLKIKF